MVKVEIKQLNYRGKSHIGIYFRYDEKLRILLKKLGAEYSYTFQCWHIENNKENEEKLLKMLEGHAEISLQYADKMRLDETSNVRSNLTMAVQQELDMLEKYLRTRRYSERTIKIYLSLATLFLGYYKDKPVQEITTADVERFNHEIIIKRKMSSSMQRQLLGVIKIIFRRNGNEEVDTEQISRPRKEYKLPQVLSKEEILEIISVIDNIKHRAIISLMYSAGLRVGELIGLELRDIDSKRMLIRISQGKGRKDRYVGLSERILILLRNYFVEYSPQRYLFEGEVRNKYSEESIRNILKAACNKCGIVKRVTPHTLRHSYATHLLESGVDLRYVQELLGHSRPETTMIYTHVTKKQLGSIVSPFDRLFLPDTPTPTHPVNPNKPPFNLGLTPDILQDNSNNSYISIRI